MKFEDFKTAIMFQKVTDVTLTKDYCGTPFEITFTLEKGERFSVGAGSVSFDQYSSTPCLNLGPYEEPRKAPPVKKEETPKKAGRGCTDHLYMTGCPACEKAVNSQKKQASGKRQHA